MTLSTLFNLNLFNSKGAIAHTRSLHVVSDRTFRQENCFIEHFEMEFLRFRISLHLNGISRSGSTQKNNFVLDKLKD